MLGHQVLYNVITIVKRNVKLSTGGPLNRMLTADGYLGLGNPAYLHKPIFKTFFYIKSYYTEPWGDLHSTVVLKSLDTQKTYIYFLEPNFEDSKGIKL